jgi:ribosomal protein S18 acetylase RimI-like enzyme
MQPTPLPSNEPYAFPVANLGRGIEKLSDSHRDEALRFIHGRGLHCAYLTGLILDNGMTSPHNRGTFFAYRNYLGDVRGVALVGHITIIETADDEALQLFADLARSCKTAHLIMCEAGQTPKFWKHYSSAGRGNQRTNRELLFELRWPSSVLSSRQQLRLATAEDLDLLVPVHASMAYEESGVDPRDVDNDGFLERYKRRIQQGRTWVLIENGQLMFKADVVTETRETSYVEGVWIHPDARGEGVGRNCMAHLSRMLLWRSRSICLLVNDENKQAQSFYKQCGYRVRAAYDTIFVK